MKTKKSPKKKNKELTARQQKLVNLILENLGTEGSTKSMYDMMLEAGYSKNTAHEQSTTLAGLRGAVDPIVKTLIDKRQKALENIDDEKLKKSAARDLAYISDILTKNIQLLSGGATGREETGVMTDEQIERIARRITDGGSKG